MSLQKKNISQNKNSMSRDDVLLGFKFFPDTSVNVMMRLTSIKKDVQQHVDKLIEQELLVQTKLADVDAYTYALSKVGAEVVRESFPEYSNQKILKCKEIRKNMLMQREHDFLLDLQLLTSIVQTYGLENEWFTSIDVYRTYTRKLFARKTKNKKRVIKTEQRRYDMAYVQLMLQWLLRSNFIEQSLFVDSIWRVIAT